MINAIAETSIAISDSLALSLVVKETVIAALDRISVRIARSNRASVRHLQLTAVFIILLALPFGASFAPSLPIAVARFDPPASSMWPVQVPDAVAANTVNAAVGLQTEVS